MEQFISSNEIKGAKSVFYSPYIQNPAINTRICLRLFDLNVESYVGKEGLRQRDSGTMGTI